MGATRSPFHLETKPFGQRFVTDSPRKSRMKGQHGLLAGWILSALRCACWSFLSPKNNQSANRNVKLAVFKMNSQFRKLLGGCPP